MKTFPSTTPAPALKNKQIQRISLIYAGVLILMAVGQLFSFEKFIPLVNSFNLPGGRGMGTLIAGLIVVAEVFALPFLIRMRVSILMRWLSIGCAGLIPIIWIMITIWLAFTSNTVDNVGFIGVKIESPTGFISIIYSIGLAVLATWSIWGMWPSPSQPTAVEKKHSKR